VVCACRLVGEDAVVAAVRAGAGTLLELIRRSDAGTRCGACVPTVWQILTREQEDVAGRPSPAAAETA
jgi:NAD(P)H-nitrite reductase large subunit